MHLEYAFQDKIMEIEQERIWISMALLFSTNMSLVMLNSNGILFL